VERSPVEQDPVVHRDATQRIRGRAPDDRQVDTKPRTATRVARLKVNAAQRIDVPLTIRTTKLGLRATDQILVICQGSRFSRAPPSPSPTPDDAGLAATEPSLAQVPLRISTLVGRASPQAPQAVVDGADTVRVGPEGDRSVGAIRTEPSPTRCAEALIALTAPRRSSPGSSARSGSQCYDVEWLAWVCPVGDGPGCRPVPDAEVRHGSGTATRGVERFP